MNSIYKFSGKLEVLAAHFTGKIPLLQTLLRKQIRLGSFVCISIFLTSLVGLALAFAISFSINQGIVEQQLREMSRSVSRQTFNMLFNLMKNGFTKKQMQEHIDSMARGKDGNAYHIRFYKNDGNETDAQVKDVMNTGNILNAKNGFLLTDIYPVKAEMFCLKCHPQARAGNVLGAVSVQQNIGGIIAASRQQFIIYFLLFAPLTFLLAGIIAIFLKAKLRDSEQLFRAKINNLSTSGGTITENMVEDANMGFVEFNDWTAEIEQQKRLFESGRFSSQIIDSAQEGIIVFGRDLRYKVWNPYMEKMTGVAAGEVMGKHPMELFPFLREAGVIERLERVLAGEMPEPAELQFKVPQSGKTGWSLDTQAPLKDTNGDIIGVILTVCDITDRVKAERRLQESEDKFRSIFEQAIDGIMIADPMQRRNIEANKAICDMLGYTRDELISLRIEDTHPKEDLPRILDLFERQVRGEISFVSDIPMLRKDGSVLYVDVNATYVTLGGKKFLVGIFRDITDRKLTDEHLKKTIMERETLLRELYHRTKNNMNTISSLINLQTASLQSDGIAIHMFRDLQDRIMSMALVHERLYKSKDLSNVNLKDYVSDLANTLITGYKINRDKLSLRLDIEDFTLSIDTLMPCGLIINELMTNSLKYAFVDGREGQISIKGQVSAESEIKLVYSDNGIGFPEGFDFTKVETLGLRLINGLITGQLRGKIEITTRPETVFTFSFREPRYQQRI